jgi:hypothetical protein
VSDGARLHWRGLDYRMFTACAACGEMRYCAGRERVRMLCLECFAVDAGAVRARRGGKPGPRSGYTYRMRRAKVETIRLVCELRATGLIERTIARQLGLELATVRRYLRLGLGPAKNGSQSRSQTHEFGTEKKSAGDCPS